MCKLDRNAEVTHRTPWLGAGAVVVALVVPPPAFAAYVGCYTDADNRALPNLLGTGYIPDQCIIDATTARYCYAGLQWYDQCWAGNDLRYDRVSDSECNTPCSQQPDRMCGGAYRNSIFTTGACPTTIPGYQGCYTDAVPRALPTFFGTHWNIEGCIETARRGGLAYAGLQYGGECWGGNQLAYDRVGDGDCNMGCDYAPGQICGGVWRNSVYATGNPPFTDFDHDGIDDTEEVRIATALLPPIWVSSHEHCPWPDPNKPIIFRARHPRCTSGLQPQDYILINYYVLFSDDCGLGGHRGDNEGFVVFGRLSGGQWQRHSLSATAHADTLCEQRTSFSGPGFGIFSSGDKHSNFTNVDQCDHGPFFCDNGDCGFFPPHTYNERGVRLVNVGEPMYHMVETYDQIYPGWWGRIWNGQMMDAGESHFDLSRFDAATAPPPGCGNWVLFD